MKKSNSPNLEVILEQMIEWALECGNILNEHLIKSYKKPLKVLDKGKQGISTEADVLSEKYVMGKISKYYPGHKILSEEDAFARQLKIERATREDYLWLIDPLDGTNNFYNRVPFFGVSLAFAKGDTILVGVVYNPVNCELFYGIKNKGAFLLRMIGQKEVHIQLKKSKSNKEFKEALISANLGSKKVEKDLLKEFPEVRAMRRFGSAALEMCYVAAGMLDAYLEHRLQPWDMAAAALICQEAGVELSTITGEPFHPFCTSILCAEKALYMPLINTLNSR